MMIRFACAALLAPALFAQPPTLAAADAIQLFTRTVQLMEAATVAVPDLAKSGAPLTDASKQTLAALSLRPTDTAGMYQLLSNARAFLVLSDAVGRPAAAAPESLKQMAELRESVSRIEDHFRGSLVQRESQVRSPDRDNTRRYAEANQRLAPPTPGKRRVVFLGDSITDFWRLNEYFPDADYVNRGISGQVTSEMLGRFQADVINLKPEAVLILAGTNDLARGTNIVIIENNLSMMSDLATRHGIRVIFASVLPVNDYRRAQSPLYERTHDRSPVLIKALNEWMKATAAQRGYTYCDYHAAMVDNQGQLTEDLADDGLHPNPQGYRIMAPLAQAAIQKTMPQMPAAQQKPRRARLF